MAWSSTANLGDARTQAVFIADGFGFARSLPRRDVAGKEKLPQSTFGIDCSKALARVFRNYRRKAKTNCLLNPRKMSNEKDDPGATTATIIIPGGTSPCGRVWLA